MIAGHTRPLTPATLDGVTETPSSNVPVHALSTMWSQGRFRHDGHDTDDMLAFAEAVARLGFPAIEINYVIPLEGVEALLSNNHVEIVSLHSPTPRVKTRDGKLSDALNLASTDEDERAFAVERRREAAPRYVPHARRSLAEITEYAAARSVAVGLENRYHYHEFPGIDEMLDMLRGYPHEVAGFWLDIGHAEVLDRLGLEYHHRWLNELASRCIGAHVHDIDGLADHRAPGHGDANWPHYAAMLPPHIPRVFEINQKMPEDQVAAAIPFLRGRGVLPALT